MDVMCDLEFLGTNTAKSLVLSVGLVSFELNGSANPVIGGATEIKISIQDSLNRGFEIDANTLGWWMMQSNSARESVFDKAKMLSIRNATDKIKRFMNKWLTDEGLLWANGLDKDIAYLQNLFYSIYPINVPWKYNQTADYRTMIRHMRKIIGFKPEYEWTGTSHNSLDDAMNQVKYLNIVTNHYNKKTNRGN